MGRMDRTSLQQAYIRVCTDSNFRMKHTVAAHLAASTVGVHPMEILGALGLDNMERIAAGEHPCVAEERRRQESAQNRT